MKTTTNAAFALAATSLLASAAIAQATTTFDNGTEGWSVSGRDDIAQTGNPGAGLDVELIDVFGAEIRNSTNQAFLGDYTRFGAPIELSVDIKINSISSPFFPGELPRELVVELRDFDDLPDSGLPWTSVWFSLGVLDASVNNDWVTYSVIIDDPTQATLPAGWGGYGDEDPNTFEPILPADRTFDSVLRSVDEIQFTTFVPGFFFGFTNFDMQVDNPTLRVVPAPTSAAVLAMGGLLATRRRR